MTSRISTWTSPQRNKTKSMKKKEPRKPRILKFQIINDFTDENGKSLVPVAHWCIEKKEIPIYHIDSFHQLTQFVGYAKYKNGNIGGVYLRGQTSLYENENKDGKLKAKLTPSCFRKQYASSDIRISKITEKLHAVLSSHKTLQGYSDDIAFPLLQHYGMKTYWLDVVDNLWVALWFALHDFKTKIVEDRQLCHIHETDNKNVYILLLCSEDNCRKGKISVPQGVYYGERTVLVDLRRALPSIYLRPHAQHALMLRKTKIPLCTDYSDLIVGIAELSKSKALSWIGHTGLLSAQSLFPSQYFDGGYSRMLQFLKKTSVSEIGDYGSIQHITIDYFS